MTTVKPNKIKYIQPPTSCHPCCWVIHSKISLRSTTPIFSLSLLADLGQGTSSAVLPFFFLEMVTGGNVGRVVVEAISTDFFPYSFFLHSSCNRHLTLELPLKKTLSLFWQNTANFPHPLLLVVVKTLVIDSYSTTSHITLIAIVCPTVVFQ